MPRKTEEPNKPKHNEAPGEPSAVLRVERDRVEEAGKESFPASDPPAWLPLHIGGRIRRS